MRASFVRLEKVHVHAVHVLELVRVGCTKPEGASGMDHEARPYPPSFQLILYRWPARDERALSLNKRSTTGQPIINTK